MHVQCEERFDVVGQQRLGTRNTDQSEDDDEDEGDVNSDWENSIATSDLDTTDESGPENDLEVIMFITIPKFY